MVSGMIKIKVLKVAERNSSQEKSSVLNPSPDQSSIMIPEDRQTKTWEKMFP